MKKFRYYCSLRPPTPGAVPKKGLINVVAKDLIWENLNCYGYVEYDRELSKEEIWDYDLEPPIIKKTKKEAMKLYEEFLYEFFDADEDRITDFLYDKEGFKSFMRNQDFVIR